TNHPLIVIRGYQYHLIPSIIPGRGRDSVLESHPVGKIVEPTRESFSITARCAAPGLIHTRIGEIQFAVMIPAIRMPRRPLKRDGSSASLCKRLLAWYRLRLNYNLRRVIRHSDGKGPFIQTIEVLINRRTD